MSRFLQIIEGKKTVIGIFSLFLAGAIGAFFQGSGWVSPDWLNGIVSLLEYFGYAAGTVGVAHKIGKGEIKVTKGATTE